MISNQQSYSILKNAEIVNVHGGTVLIMAPSVYGAMIYTWVTLAQINNYEAVLTGTTTVIEIDTVFLQRRGFI